MFIRGPSKRKRKLEEVKELELTNYDLDIANARMQQEIDDLKGLVIEYKDRLNESIKYNDIVQNLIDEGKLNEYEEDKIQF